jgi:peptide/nickel transport system ATP-binding protein
MSHLAIEGLRVRVGVGRQAFAAVDGVDLEIESGAVVGLVGESGSGKSTLARTMVGLLRPDSGRITLESRDYAAASGRRLKELRRRVQLVFQDPRSSLNPRMTVGEAIGEAIAVHRRMTRASRGSEVRRLLELVALDPTVARAVPAALSGGQRQRVALARALAVQPDVIVADEITASLDVSVQGAVLNLLRDLRRETGLSLLVISHNLAVVRYLSDAVAVMQLGRIVEHGATADVIGSPQHPYTRTLIESVELSGLAAQPPVLRDPPDPLHPPSGCRFHTVCPVGPLAQPNREVCAAADPADEARLRMHRAACHYAPRIGEPRSAANGR